MSVISASWLVFMLIAVAGGAIYLALYGSYQERRNRFVEATLKLRGSDEHGEEEAERRAGVWLKWAMERMPAQRDPAAAGRTARMLARAGFYRSRAAVMFRLVRALSAAAGVAIGFGVGYLLKHAGTEALLMAGGGGFAGLSAPAYLVNRRGRTRQRTITRQLSDVLDLLVVCVEAGLGLFEALKLVGQETERQGQEIGGELMLVSGEVTAGSALGPALRRLAERTAVPDLRPLASTLIQSEQLGAQIGPALRSSSDMLRTKRRLRAEEAAQKTTIKILFPLVLFILPAMLLVILAPALIQAIHTLSM
jgi:tight adherence protein C